MPSFDDFTSLQSQLDGARAELRTQDQAVTALTNELDTLQLRFGAVDADRTRWHQTAAMRAGACRTRCCRSAASRRIRSASAASVSSGSGAAAAALRAGMAAFTAGASGFGRGMSGERPK